MDLLCDPLEVESRRRVRGRCGSSEHGRIAVRIELACQSPRIQVDVHSRRQRKDCELDCQGQRITGIRRVKILKENGKCFFDAESNFHRNVARESCETDSPISGHFLRSLRSNRNSLRIASNKSFVVIRAHIFLRSRWAIRATSAWVLPFLS